MRIRDRLRVSDRRQRQLTRVMEVCLVGVFFIGLDRGNPGVVVNAGIAFLVTFLPAVLERDYDIPMDAGLTLWITTAVFLHAVGTLGPYSSRMTVLGIGWDNVTHTLSASLVAAIGYSTARAIDRHIDDVHLPPKFMFVFILLFVLAFGVVWEVLEFAIGEAAAMFGTGTVLTQYGLEDTMKDLMFNTVGGIIVAVWGTAYLTDVVGALEEHLDGRDQRAD
ncbi:hypothetical protein NGM10_15175 [Halorussus salilacus]|uniref:hypothetical protein n=1 Tax=Halorussus salilacus TaxID=2953750 RepID=UPI0020A0B001|nr:hypothetical protein [Halorussus salilacus]USZ68062.1 hypothetical protein NGM10_15175 [Halorussus salilacus]